MSPEQLEMSKIENYDTEIYTCSAVFSGLAVLAVTIRVTSRHMKNVAVGIDDILLVTALVSALAQTVNICIGAHEYGLGRHVWTLTEDQFAAFNKAWWIIAIIQQTPLFLTKLVILILFHRIFITPMFRLALKVIGGIIGLWWIGATLSIVLICIPTQRHLNPTIPGYCGNKQLLFILPPIPWIVTDLAVLLMPLPMVWNLHLPRIQRVGVAALFLLGGFATVASCVRFSTLFFKPADVTYTLVTAAIWTIIEYNVTIISACLIVSRPWIVRLYPARLLSLIREATVSIRMAAPIRKTNVSSSRGERRNWPNISDFRKLPETSPALTSASLGAPFTFDVEKGTEFGTQSDWVEAMRLEELVSQ